MLSLILSALLASNGLGHTLVRQQQGTIVPRSCTLLTNMALWSEGFTNAAWVPAGAISGTPDQVVAPNGTLTADKIVVGSVAAGNNLHQTFTNLTQNTTYTGSIWVWTDTGTKSFRLARTNRVTWVTAAVSETFTATTTPQLFSLTYTTAAGETASDFMIGSEQKTPFSQSSGNYYYWGAQHVPSGRVTPYIQTTTAAVTACR